MMINPLFECDFYKVGHVFQYPEGTTEVYSNFTPRSSRMANIASGSDGQSVLFFGLQAVILEHFMTTWTRDFFARDKNEVLSEYQSRMADSLGALIDVSHIAALHDLRYLPLRIKALPEGSIVPVGVPVLTVVNTHPAFFWLTNYIETMLSAALWKPITSATTAFEYRKLVDSYALKTLGDREGVTDFQCHDFSFRGMSGLFDAVMSGMAHLTCFYGTDTIPAINGVIDFYGAESSQAGFSVPATEHSVMCMGEQSGELQTFRRLIEDIYPTGIVSIVSDTWDFWKVIGDYLPKLRSHIMNRDGKVVIRPDSGDPVKIICGDPMAEVGSLEHKGAVEALWDTFGGAYSRKHFKVLDEHIGLIYGDSITIQRAEEILRGLYAKGFASNNIVFGVGSYTYQHVTRDNYGFAMKATSGVVNGKRRDIFKAPKTDDGGKHSARGLLRVERENGKYVLYDQQTPEQEKQGELRVIYEDGDLVKATRFDQVRQRVNDELNHYFWMRTL